jgi:hypothetical protein
MLSLRWQTLIFAVCLHLVKELTADTAPGHLPEPGRSRSNLGVARTELKLTPGM